ncbi:MAG TPA: hypothetical protein PKD20_02275 [Candidatus Saccharibacteria bacterium]|jgi:hypothetical protein|nr:hypothetical protein [Candidatus Saccharibacteria bacterium]HMT55681.1 hypothetical protein [Candidatus Saccharibacteria bacterium]
MLKLNLRRRIHFYEVFNLLVWTLTVCMFFISWFVVHWFKQDTLNATVLSTTISVLCIVIIFLFTFHFAYDGLLHVMLQKRSKTLMQLAFKHDMNMETSLPLSATLLRLSERKSFVQQTNVFRATDWGFCDFQFSVVRKNKYRDFLAKTYYYAVAEFDLPRKLPNIFFDSKQTGGREFGIRFRKTQRHSLEGNFDRFFQTYFHEDYTIDNLSFITPEIMHVLIEAKDCDIEIYDNKLYLYNELENMPEQLLQMERHGKKIRAKLLHNIATYRDERVDGDYARKTVSVYGIRLRRAVGMHYARGAFFALILIVSVGISLTKAVSGIGLYGVIVGTGGIIRELMTLRDIVVDEKVRRHNKNIGA